MQRKAKRNFALPADLDSAARLSPNAKLCVVGALVLFSCAICAVSVRAQEESGQLVSGQLNPVTVTGEDSPLSQTRATTEKRLAPNIEDIQSAEQIARFPDVGLADAIKRLPGVGVQNDTGEGRFLTIRGLDSNLVGVTYNGVRIPSNDSNGRHVAFDQIPAGLVSRVIVTKANTPDMDAEALGGTIELDQRSAFDFPKSTIEGHIGSGYEPLRSGYPIIDGEIIGAIQFGFGPGGNPLSDFGRSGNTGQLDTANVGSGGGLNPNRPFGLVSQFSYYEDHRGIDDFEPAYSDMQNTPTSLRAQIKSSARSTCVNTPITGRDTDGDSPSTTARMTETRSI